MLSTEFHDLVQFDVEMDDFYLARLLLTSLPSSVVVFVSQVSPKTAFLAISIEMNISI